MARDFEEKYRVILFDHIGTAAAELTGWDPEAYSDLDRYADDVCAVVEELDLHDIIFVGHSVSSMICGLAAARMPDRIHSVIMVGPSPRYLNDGDYRGGFESADIEELLTSIQSNYQGWSEVMAPAIMGRPDAPEHGQELTAHFCEQDQDVAYHFARVTFLSDNREDLKRMDFPVLVLQCSNDIIAPETVGRYTATHLPKAKFHQLAASGHCPNLSAPDQTAAAINAFLAEQHG